MALELLLGKLLVPGIFTRAPVLPEVEPSHDRELCSVPSPPIYMLPLLFRHLNTLALQMDRFTEGMHIIIALKPDREIFLLNVEGGHRALLHYSKCSIISCCNQNPTTRQPL